MIRRASKAKPDAEVRPSVRDWTQLRQIWLKRPFLRRFNDIGRVCTLIIVVLKQKAAQVSLVPMG